MKARQLFERAAAPVEAPPRPGVRPDTAPPPARPGRAQPGKHPNPFRRRAPHEQPNPAIRPAKAVDQYESVRAKDLIRSLR